VPRLKVPAFGERAIANGRELVLEPKLQSISRRARRDRQGKQNQDQDFLLFMFVLLTAFSVPSVDKKGCSHS